MAAISSQQTSHHQEHPWSLEHLKAPGVLHSILYNYQMRKVGYMDSFWLFD